MGCDIHSFVEGKKNGIWDQVSWKSTEEYNEGPFDDRCYGIFSFLTGGEIRNYSGIESPFTPKGVPLDVSEGIQNEIEEWDSDGHTHSWLSIEELTNFNYNIEIEDRRYTEQVSPNYFNGGATCEVGKGERMTWMEFLGKYFFNHLKILQEMTKQYDDLRIVFFFDN